MKKLFDALASMHYLSADFKEALTEVMRVVRFPKNHFLLQTHSVANQAYFLNEGFAVSYHYHQGQKIVTRFWKEGDIILSPRSFFGQAPSDEIIQLTIDCELLSITYRDVVDLFERFPVANHISRIVTTEYYTRCRDRVIHFYRLSTWEHYQELLHEYPGIELNVSQDLIASYLHCTPQTLSRLKHERN